MTEDEAVQKVLAMRAASDADTLDTVHDRIDCFEAALPRIQSALRLAEAVDEWGSRYLCWHVEPDMIVDGEDAGKKFWRVTDYQARFDEDVVAEGDTIPEAVSALRAKLSHDPGHEPKE